MTLMDRIWPSNRRRTQKEIDLMMNNIKKEIVDPFCKSPLEITYDGIPARAYHFQNEQKDIHSSEVYIGVFMQPNGYRTERFFSEEQRTLHTLDFFLKKAIKRGKLQMQAEILNEKRKIQCSKIQLGCIYYTNHSQVYFLKVIAIKNDLVTVIEIPSKSTNILSFKSGDKYYLPVLESDLFLRNSVKVKIRKNGTFYFKKNEYAKLWKDEAICVGQKYS